MLARRRRAFCRRPPAAATGGANFQTVAGMQFDADFQSAYAMPLTDRGIAVAAGGCAAAGTGLEHVPDEIAAIARVLTLDGDAEAATPPRHRALRTGCRQRLHDRFDDLVGGMAGA